MRTADCEQSSAAWEGERWQEEQISHERAARGGLPPDDLLLLPPFPFSRNEFIERGTKWTNYCFDGILHTTST